MLGAATTRAATRDCWQLAERIAIPAAAVSPPTPTAWLRSKSATGRTNHASAMATRRLYADSPTPWRSNMPAGLYQGSRGPWRRGDEEQGGLRRAHKLFTANENYKNSRLHQSLRCLRPQHHQDSSIHTLFGLKPLGDARLHPTDESLGPLT